jgi:thioredoxin-like negative regulator of GroEL
MKKADQRQLKAMLEPVARTWFEHKFKKVQTLFEQEISGDMLQTIEQARAEAERSMDAAQKAAGSAAGGGAR